MRHDILYRILNLGIRVLSLTGSYNEDIFRESWCLTYGNYSTRLTLLYDLCLPFLVSIKGHTCSLPPSSELGPWMLQMMSMDMTLKSYGSKDDNPNLLKSVADSMIQSNVHFMNVFTDATKHSDGAVGIGIVIYPPAGTSVTLALRLTDSIPIYKAELFAIYYALLYISSVYSKQKIYLYSDSMSSIASLKSGHSASNPSLLQALLELVSASQLNVTVVWVPSHIGISGNEEFDRVANQAADHESIDIQLPSERLELQAMARSYVHHLTEE